MKRDFKKIFKYYGEQNQLKKLEEELLELLLEVKYLLKIKAPLNDSLFSEMADVYVLLSQFREAYRKKIDFFVRYKTKRQLWRIKKEQEGAKNA